jgi:hypothetical protein
VTDEPCNTDEPVDDEQDDVECVTPRMVWGGATNFMGVVDRDNPGHFRRRHTDGDGTAADEA